MRKLEKIIRSVSLRRDSGKVLLAALVGVWLVAASTIARVGSHSTFEGFEERTPSANCGLMLAVSCSSRMLLNPAILAKRIDMVPLGTTKVPYRPSRFGFQK